MDYEQKYKEALERAKKELRVCGSQDCDAARQIFRFFPELKESEDERMKKAIMPGRQQHRRFLPLPHFPQDDGGARKREQTNDTILTHHTLFHF